MRNIQSSAIQSCRSVTISCCTVAPYDNGTLCEVLAALTELTQQLETYYPDLPRIEVKSSDLEPDQIESYLRRNMPGTTAGELAAESESCSRLFVLLDESHPFVESARAENPRAHWGIAVPRIFSVAWVRNKYLWWHEALHLLNAKDCYNKFCINKCPDQNCIMRAAPTHGSCGGRLHLCSKNQRRLLVELRS